LRRRWWRWARTRSGASRRWLLRANLNAGHQPVEILRMAFVRGRFCELAAGLCALDQTEQYLLGCSVLLPAMLALPMAQLAPALPLREKIREALDGDCEPGAQAAGLGGVS
jgi:c-di-GMP-related signal transduction protein